MTTAFCPQTCGDGRRFEYECDDGNLRDGDGCDSQCFIEEGWTCNGGNAQSRSLCMQSTPNRSFMSLTRPIRLVSSVAQGVTLSYIPSKLADNFCQQCDDLLLVTLVQFTIKPAVDIQFLPTTKFKFLITFKFNGIFAIPDFIYSVKINPKYSSYFSREDLAQI